MIQFSDPHPIVTKAPNVTKPKTGRAPADRRRRDDGRGATISTTRQGQDCCEGGRRGSGDCRPMTFDGRDRADAAAARGGPSTVEPRPMGRRRRRWPWRSFQWIASCALGLIGPAPAGRGARNRASRCRGGGGLWRRVKQYPVSGSATPALVYPVNTVFTAPRILLYTSMIASQRESRAKLLTKYYLAFSFAENREQLDQRTTMRRRVAQ